MTPSIGKRNRGQGVQTFLLALGLILLLAAPARGVPQGGYAHPEILIQPEELKALVDRKDPNLRIIDVRHKAKYYLGHVPGALEVWRPDLEDKKNPGLIPPRAQMEALLSRLGVSGKDTLILYGDLYDHTRLWLILVYYGFPLERLRLLDGGIGAWRAKGYPTQLTAPRVTQTKVKLTGKSPLPSLLANLAAVKEASPDPGKVIVDVRSQRQYLGQQMKEGAARPGHIPGALSLEWREAVVSQGPYKGYLQPAAEIKKIYEAQGVTPDKDIFLYSHNGLPATLTLLSLYLAGYPLEKLHLYAGSWIEWSRSPEAVEMGDASSRSDTPVKIKKSSKTEATKEKPAH
ncbi:MAG: sulfurtransferase [Desulfobaccales bacterium]